jgi:hypothetical protein
MTNMEEFAKNYVPLISAVISLVSVSIALTALRYSRQNRREQQRVAELDALRRQQDGLMAALQGEKESVGFMALQLARDPKLINESNQTRLLSALCLAFVFESSSRARALVLKTLRNLSSDNTIHGDITSILDEVMADFSTYEAEIGSEELKKYLERLQKLKGSLREGAAQQGDRQDVGQQITL